MKLRRGRIPRPCSALYVLPVVVEELLQQLMKDLVQGPGVSAIAGLAEQATLNHGRRRLVQRIGQVVQLGHGVGPVDAPQR